MSLILKVGALAYDVRQESERLLASPHYDTKSVGRSLEQIADRLDTILEEETT